MSRPSIPVARPAFGPEEERLVLEVLRSGWVAQGPQVAAFEARFAEIVGAPHAIAVSSGTSALFLALVVLGCGPGDEVIVPSLSFIASANAIAHCGATPVFVDVEPHTYNLDPTALDALVTPRTRAIMVVHQLGLPADLDAIEAVAARHGLPLVEDAACALGSRWRGRPIGGRTHLAAFSFHARKVVVTGEGGMITTGDAALAARLRRLRHQGMSVSDLERHAAARVIIEDYPEVGYNCRLSDLQAAVGVAQLAKLDDFVATRRAIASRYAAGLGDLPALVLPALPPGAETNYQSFIVRLAGATRAQRDRVMDEMHTRGVATRRGLMAAHLEPCYAGRPVSLPHTEAATRETLVLPMYTELSESDQGYVIASLREVVTAVLGVRTRPA